MNRDCKHDPMVVCYQVDTEHDEGGVVWIVYICLNCGGYNEQVHRTGHEIQFLEDLHYDSGGFKLWALFPLRYENVWYFCSPEGVI